MSIWVFVRSYKILRQFNLTFHQQQLWSDNNVWLFINTTLWNDNSVRLFDNKKQRHFWNDILRPTFRLNNNKIFEMTKCPTDHRDKTTKFFFVLQKSFRKTLEKVNSVKSLFECAGKKSLLLAAFWLSFYR